MNRFRHASTSGISIPAAFASLTILLAYKEKGKLAGHEKPNLTRLQNHWLVDHFLFAVLSPDSLGSTRGSRHLVKDQRGTVDLGFRWGECSPDDLYLTRMDGLL
jgi:hypothetical protein